MKNIIPKDCKVKFVPSPAGCRLASNGHFSWYRVSSTLDSSSGKKYLLDGSDETCWSSAQASETSDSLDRAAHFRMCFQGLPQTIHLSWSELIPATHFALTFQGGFSGTTASVYIAASRPGGQTPLELGMAFAGKVYPKDSNARQVFE